LLHCIPHDFVSFRRSTPLAESRPGGGRPLST